MKKIFSIAMGIYLKSFEYEFPDEFVIEQISQIAEHSTVHLADCVAAMLNEIALNDALTHMSAESYA